MFIYGACAFLGLIGISIIWTSGILYLTVQCEKTEVINITNYTKINNGINLCNISFIYNYESMYGYAVYPCPDNINDTIAVCYPVNNPSNYNTKLLESEFSVMPHTLIVKFLNIGFLIVLCSAFLMYIRKNILYKYLTESIELEYQRRLRMYEYV